MATLLYFLSIISISRSSQCQIQTGLFPTIGAKLFNTIYSSGNMSLYYKLWIPPNIDINNVALPIIVLIHGSGPQNHDEQVPTTDDEPDFFTFRDIASSLCAEYNIITFAYDKRSCTPYAPVPCIDNQPPICTLDNTSTDWCLNPYTITYLDFVADAIYAIQYILSMFPNLTPSKIIPTGHSQGASMHL